MFVCNDCGEVFEECKVIEEPRPYGMGFAIEYLSVCPCCGEGGIEEAKRCENCGEYGLADNMKHSEANELYLCDICYGDLYGE